MKPSPPSDRGIWRVLHPRDEAALAIASDAWWAVAVPLNLSGTASITGTGTVRRVADAAERGRTDTARPDAPLACRLPSIVAASAYAGRSDRAGRRASRERARRTTPPGTGG